MSRPDDVTSAADFQARFADGVTTRMSVLTSLRISTSCGRSNSA